MTTISYVPHNRDKGKSEETSKGQNERQGIKIIMKSPLLRKTIKSPVETLPESIEPCKPNDCHLWGLSGSSPICVQRDRTVVVGTQNVEGSVGSAVSKIYRAGPSSSRQGY